MWLFSQNAGSIYPLPIPEMVAHKTNLFATVTSNLVSDGGLSNVKVIGNGRLEVLGQLMGTVHLFSPGTFLST